MKKNIYFLLVFVLASSYAFAQDEGKVVVKDRFERDNTLYFSVGPSFTLGKNLGDYSTGFNFELGYLKRKNRILSIGPSLSYLFFDYDPGKTQKYYYNTDNDLGEELSFTGGDVSLLSLGFNVKVNFIPVSDNTKFSVYGIATPFVAMASKSEMTGTVGFYSYNSTDQAYDIFRQENTFTKDDVDGFKKQSNFTGGLHVGIGFEFRPAQKLSFFGQAAFSYTLPVNYISTSSFLSTDAIVGTTNAGTSNEKTYYDESKTIDQDAFPIVKKGFSAASIKIGIAYNF